MSLEGEGHVELGQLGRPGLLGGFQLGEAGLQAGDLPAFMSQGLGEAFALGLLALQRIALAGSSLTGHHGAPDFHAARTPRG